MTQLKQSDLIPFEDSNVDVRKSRKRIAIGHNVGFDRSFLKEQYFIEVNKFQFLIFNQLMIELDPE